MRYRRLGKTGLMVSEIGLGGEWLERHNTEECVAVIKRCEEAGINILDCWMSNPEVRSNIGIGIRENRDKWYIQGQIGSFWDNGQHTRTREMPKVVAGFKDLLARMQTDFIDLGVIHYVDSMQEWQDLQHSPFMDYVFDLKEKGIIRHIGLSTHNPLVGQEAARCGYIEMMLFSINPAYDMRPASEDLEECFAEHYEPDLPGRIHPERAKLYKMCEQLDVGLTVMKGYGGGRLLDARRSPFGVALTPVQLIHYALTRPAVASVLVGYDTPQHVDDAVAYESATDEEKNYAAVLAGAPLHAFDGQCTYCGHCQPCPVGIDIAMVNKLYDLAVLQEAVPGSVRDHYKVLGAKASDCIGCGSCEAECPFHVKVAERMVETAKLLG